MINTLTTVTSEVLEEIAAEQKLRQTHEVFLLFAMGSQFDHLIKLALEKLGVCLGFQMWAAHRGAVVASAEHREFGAHALRLSPAGAAILFFPLSPPCPGCSEIISINQYSAARRRSSRRCSCFGREASSSLPMICSGVNRTLPMVAPFFQFFSYYA